VPDFVVIIDDRFIRCAQQLQAILLLRQRHAAIDQVWMHVLSQR
jgi:hypothetical protein